ncbi:MAG: hypothetical protein ACRDMZ_20600, partial [Solirubrobacteraceae bacterium]
LQLRLYQTMVEVASQPNMTIVLPVPIELLAGGPNAQAAQNAQTAAQTMLNAAATLAGSANAKQLAGAAPPSETTESLKAVLSEPRTEAKKDKVPR